MTRRLRVAAVVAIVLSVVAAAGPVGVASAANQTGEGPAVGSQHTDFGTGGEASPQTLDNMSVSGSGDSATVTLDTGGASITGDDFEDGDANGWTAVDGDTLTATTDAKNGTYGANYSVGTSGWGNLIYDSRVNASATGDVAIKGYVKENSSDDERGGLALYDEGRGKWFRSDFATIGDTSDDFKLRSYAGGDTPISSANIDLAYGTWYWVNVTYDRSANTVYASVYNSKGGSELAQLNGSVSSFDPNRFAIASYRNSPHFDSLEYTNVASSDASTGVYVSANHSVTNASTLKTNITITNATADVTVEEFTGSQWQAVASATYSTDGNKSLDISSAQYDKFRTNVTVQNQTTNGAPSFSLYDESILFTNHAPTASNISPTNGTKLQTQTPTFEVDVNDTEFSTAQGDSVTASLYIDGGYVGSQTLTSNGTANISTTVVAGGEHSYYWTLNDSYGAATITTTRTVQTPATLYVRNESAPTQLLNNATVTLRFYPQTDAPQIVKRTASDGTINMTGLPTGTPFVVVADADGYVPRRIYLSSLYGQQSIYLLPKNKTHVEQILELKDYSGQFDKGDTVVEVQRALNGTWKTVQGDYFGATGRVSTQLRYNVRHRLVVTNVDTGAQRILRGYTPVSSTTETIKLTSAAGIAVGSGDADIQMSPTVRAVAATTGADVTVDLINANGSVAWLRADAIYVGPNGSTTTLQTVNETDASVTVSPDLTNMSAGTLRVAGSYELEDGSTGAKTAEYSIRRTFTNRASILSVLTTIPTLLPATHGTAFTTMLALFGTVMLTGGVATQFRATTEMTALVALGSLSGFAVIGWVGYDILFAGMVTFIALAALRRGL